MKENSGRKVSVVYVDRLPLSSPEEKLLELFSVCEGVIAVRLFTPFEGDRMAAARIWVEDRLAATLAVEKFNHWNFMGNRLTAFTS
jgi:hypothetical protein